MRRWNNIPGVFAIEVTSVDGAASEFDGDKLPVLDTIVHPGDDFELIIEFVSSGHYQRASMYGGPDHLGWPGEGEDERSLVRAFLSDYINKKEIELPPEIQQQLFEHYRKQIQEAELNDSESLGGILS